MRFSAKRSAYLDMPSSLSADNHQTCGNAYPRLQAWPRSSVELCAGPDQCHPRMYGALGVVFVGVGGSPGLRIVPAKYQE